MPISGKQGFKWNNATQGIEGQICYLSSEGVADYATGVTLTPAGVLINRPKQYETAQLETEHGKIVEILADGTVDIAVGDMLMTNATGRAVKAAVGGTYVTTLAWIVGIALEAYTTAGDAIIKATLCPQQGSYVAGT